MFIVDIKMENPKVIFNDWEKIWAPYDDSTYDLVLESIDRDDVVLEIGAGDLRLAHRIAEKARFVYALEMQLDVLEIGIKNNSQPLPPNICLICADARDIQFPNSVTTAVLLMRHCNYFQIYAEKLKLAGVSRLITNARWKMGVECVNLQTPRINCDEVVIGAYACWCGNVGFTSGPVELCKPEVLSITYEVVNCPQCC